MLKRAVGAGDTVESQCTRCKALLNHTVIAMVEGRVVRVKCNTCGSEHNHRPVKEPKAPAAKTLRPTLAAKEPRAARPKTSKAPAVSDEEIWEELIRPLDPDLAVPYRMDGTFRSNTLLSHPSFGIGVIAATQAGKIEVVFKSGRKLLRSAG